MATDTIKFYTSESSDNDKRIGINWISGSSEDPSCALDVNGNVNALDFSSKDYISFNTKLSELNSDVSILNSDVSVLKFNVAQANSSISEAFSDISSINNDIIDINASLASKITYPNGGANGWFLKKISGGTEWAKVEGGGGDTPTIATQMYTKLWTNANETQTKNSFSITESDFDVERKLSEFEYLAITCRLNTSDPTYSTTLVRIGHGDNAERTVCLGQGSSYRYTRLVTVSSSTIAFANGDRNGSGGTSYCIPVAIYGYELKINPQIDDVGGYYEGDTINSAFQENGAAIFAIENSPAMTITDEDILTWDNKITNPSNGTTGQILRKTSTGAEWADLSSGTQDFNELINRPKYNNTTITSATNIPAVPTTLANLSSDSTHRLVTDTEKTTWSGKYTKPNTGIPKSDLASSVQLSLDKADTALQSFTESDPVFTASPAASITSANISSWNSKGTYSKPSGGIPKSDLASTVQTSLNKADTALQSFTETDPTVPAWAKTSEKPSYAAHEVIYQSTEFETQPGNVGEALDELIETKYKKPSTGIPKSDLTAAVQSSLEKADSALQSFVETDPIFGASPAAEITSEDIVSWDGKIDMPNGGLAGQVLKKTSTGVEWATETTGVTDFELLNNRPKYNGAAMTGSTNIPIVPSALASLAADSTHRLVTDTEKSTWNGKYTKPSTGIPSSDLKENYYLSSNPSGFTDDTVANSKYTKPNTGIPKSDLAPAVQSSLARADSALQSYTETDPVFSASAAAGITASNITSWNNKGTYSKPTGGIPKSDLASSIQSSLEKADTALQSYTETDPVFSASPAHNITSANINSWNSKGTYSKPSGGIPKSDLASAVQTSLGRADTALQSYTETDPVFAASPAYGITSANITSWNNKGTYSKPSTGIPKTDLALSIQSSLEKADSALQEHQSLAAYRTSSAQDTIDARKIDEPTAPGSAGQVLATDGIGGFYWRTVSSGGEGTFDFEALNNRPKYNGVIMTRNTDIPLVPTTLSTLTSDSTHRLVTDSEKSTWNAKGTYSKPSGGIPKTDLSSNVQASLGLADTALQSFTETDPIFSASVAAGITSTDISNWNGKQATISDLATIRAGAALGTTALQSYTETDPIFTASPAHGITAANITSWNNKGTYSKPSTGIPKTDLASAVQTSLGLADTALQSYTETDPIFVASAAHGITASNISNWNGKISMPSGGTTGQFLQKTGSGVAWADVDNISDENVDMTDFDGTLREAFQYAGGALMELEGGLTNLGEYVEGLSFFINQKVPEAPIDNKIYGRKNAEWEEIPSGGTDDFEALNNRPKYNNSVMTGSTNIPLVPTALSALSADSTHRLVTDTEKSTWNSKGTYSKPSGGIPKTDLTSAVQTSLGLADTALQSYTETDPIFSASVAAGISASDITNWNNKGTYSKPSTGIPKTDLASAVQTSLNKADTALQSFTETDPIFSASPARTITQYQIADWDEAVLAIDSHITSSAIHVPTGGTTGQVLKKTTSGTEWANESGGGGGAGLQLVGTYSVSSKATATFTPPAGTTGLLCMVTYSSNTYTALIPFEALTTSYVSYGISASNTYIEIRLKNDGGTVSMSRTSTSAYNITVYAI